MRKETAWAIGIGIVFGLILAFGLWKINQSVRNNKKVDTVTQKPNSTNTPQPTQNVKISITSPENGDVLTEPTIEVKGKANPNTNVIITTSTTDYLIVSDALGIYAQKIVLESGINTITATTINDGKNEFSNVITVYSSSFDNKTASDSATTKAKSYIGTVTDITDTNIQIKTAKNEIKQISITPDSSVGNLKETSGKALKISDIAIGDTIAALGFINTTSVLNASRILVINPITDNQTEILSSKFDKEKIKTDKNTLFYEVLEGDVKKIKLTDIKPDLNIIYTKNNDQVRTVFVIQ